MLPAGRLRHKITFQQKSTQLQDNETGDVNYDWQNIAVDPSVWAAVEPISTREFISAAQERSKVTTRIVIRQRGDIDHSMRIIHETMQGLVKVYNIEGIMADKDSGLEYMTLQCSEGVRQQDDGVDS